MSITSKFSHLDNGEFLNQISEIRHQSPIIAELCARLENKEPDLSPNPRTECPVCQAALLADFDYVNNMFTLKAGNE